MLSLTACGATSRVQQPLVRTELVEVPIDRYIALPTALTDPLPYPQPPEMNCKDRFGKPRACVVDGLLWTLSWRELVDRANADRAAASRLGREAAAAGRLNVGDAENQR